MARPYTAEELLWLRESPLVTKPDTLPPAEEWMGPPPDLNQKKPTMNRAKTDESSAYNELSPRRPALFETRHILRTSGTVPDDIVLGPPKTSFTSATAIRTLGKLSDSPDRPSQTAYDDESARNDRYAFREKFFKERGRGEREAERPREPRVGPTNGRRLTREDAEGWTNVKPRKSFGQDDGERFSRRTGDRERTQGSKDSTREKDLLGEREVFSRRNGTGRARNEPTWFRDENAHTAHKEKEFTREAPKDREWRDRDRDRRDDREWTRGGRTEQDPEWMETPSREEEKKQAHTQADFQKWKERMKASNTPSDEKTREIAEQAPQPTSETPEMEQRPSRSEVPLVMDTGIDKFFGLWSEPKRADSNALSGEQAAEAKGPSKSRAPKASRFTTFFSPQEEIPHQQPEPAPPSRPASDYIQDDSNKDREGFQRILQMLGGASISSASSTPQVNIAQQPRPPPNDQRASSSSTPISAPSRGPPIRTQERIAEQDQAPSRNSSGPPNLQGLFGGAPNAQTGSAPNRDSEFLLRLMQQSRSMSSSDSSAMLRGPPPNDGQGLPHLSELMGRPQEMPRQKAQAGPMPGYFDDAPVNERREADSVREAARRKGPSGPPPGFFDDPSIASFQRRPVQDSQQRPQNMPPGLQRPPGLDPMLPPAWANNQVPPHQQGNIAPPPGFANPGVRGGPNGFPPGFLPPLPNMPMYGDRGPTGPNQGQLPPNLPPPGFFGVGGPPPGLPPMPFSNEALMALAGPGAGQPGAPRRLPFEMFGDGGGGNAGPNGRGGPG
ncbi:MAG: hypothetical protein M1819_001184 [Sarea resinae]|nr:MAG: hypothetical protein M1819_001184 [Sarea resinae]